MPVSVLFERLAYIHWVREIFQLSIPLRMTQADINVKFI